MNNEIKSGYKTTEFWLTVGTFITSGLFLLGVIGPDTRDSLTGTSHQTVETISMVIAQSAVLVRYISARKAEKQRAIHEREKSKRIRTYRKKRKKKATTNEPPRENNNKGPTTDC